MLRYVMNWRQTPVFILEGFYKEKKLSDKQTSARLESTINRLRA